MSAISPNAMKIVLISRILFLIIKQVNVNVKMGMYLKILTNNTMVAKRIVLWIQTQKNKMEIVNAKTPTQAVSQNVMKIVQIKKTLNITWNRMLAFASTAMCKLIRMTSPKDVKKIVLQTLTLIMMI